MVILKSWPCDNKLKCCEDHNISKTLTLTLRVGVNEGSLVEFEDVILYKSEVETFVGRLFVYKQSIFYAKSVKRIKL